MSTSQPHPTEAARIARTRPLSYQTLAQVKIDAAKKLPPEHASAVWMLVDEILRLRALIDRGTNHQACADCGGDEQEPEEGCPVRQMAAEARR